MFEETPKQRQFAEAALSGDYRFLAFGGGIRSGKTFTVLGLLISLCRVFARSRWAVVRRDLPTLRRNTIPSFEKLRPRSFVGAINQSTWTATCANGSEIVFFPESLDVDPDLDRWKGLEVNGFALEEANELSIRSFNKAVERAGSWVIPGDVPQPDPLVLLTFNPSPGWVKRKFYDPWKARALEAPYYYVPATIADNPYVPDEYRESLKNLPESEYRRFVAGDWDSMTGVALPELAAHHIVEPFRVPSHWPTFMAFDWGYRHPFSAGLYTTSEDGVVYKLDTITGRGMADADILAYIRAALAARGYGFATLRYTVAGGDCWNTVSARTGSPGPSTAETFTIQGWRMIPADDKPGSRVTGLSNLRRYLAGGQEARFKFVDTPGNRRCFAQMQSMLMDPDRPEDVLGVDADDSGEGGDDSYDETRYALMSRPLAANQPKPQYEDQDGKSLGYDYEKQRPRVRTTAEDEMATMYQRAQPHVTAGRYRAPQRRGVA